MLPVPGILLHQPPAQPQPMDRGVGTAAAAAAMAAAHSRPRKRVGQLYSINAHVQVYAFPAGLELVRSGRGQYFKASISRGTVSSMTRDAKVFLFLFFCGEFIVFDCSSARKLGQTPFTEDTRTFKSYKSTNWTNQTNLATCYKLDKQSTVINIWQ